MIENYLDRKAFSIFYRAPKIVATLNCFRHDKDSAKMAVRQIILLAYGSWRSAHTPGFGDRGAPRRVPNSNLCPYLVVVRPDCRLIVKPPRFSLLNKKPFAVDAILRNPLPYHDRPTCREFLCDAEFCQRLAFSVASYAGSETSGAEAKRSSSPGMDSVLFSFGVAQPQLHRLPLSPDCSPRTFLAEPIQKAHGVAEAPRMPG